MAGKENRRVGIRSEPGTGSAHLLGVAADEVRAPDPVGKEGVAGEHEIEFGAVEADRPRSVAGRRYDLETVGAEGDLVAVVQQPIDFFNPIIAPLFIEARKTGIGDCVPVLAPDGEGSAISLDHLVDRADVVAMAVGGDDLHVVRRADVVLRADEAEHLGGFVSWVDDDHRRPFAQNVAVGAIASDDDGIDLHSSFPFSNRALSRTVLSF